MHELTQNFIQEELMANKAPNPIVVEQMVDFNYRLNVLKQMLTKRFMTSQINLDDVAQMGALDNAMIVRIQENMKPTGLTERHRLYLDLGMNQNLIVEALVSLKQSVAS